MGACAVPTRMLLHRDLEGLERAPLSHLQQVSRALNPRHRRRPCPDQEWKKRRKKTNQDPKVKRAPHAFGKLGGKSQDAKCRLFGGAFFDYG